MRERQKRGEPEDPTERPCPECLSPIPVEAKRCAFCTTRLRSHRLTETFVVEPVRAPAILCVG